jgi:hypothetical protein
MVSESYQPESCITVVKAGDDVGIKKRLPVAKEPG